MDEVFLKPYKVTRQRYESSEDARELMEYMASTVKGKNPTIIGNRVIEPDDFIKKTENIMKQYDLTQSLNEDGTKGKRVYAMTYIYPKGKTTLQDGINMTKELLEEYSNYQAVAAVYNDKKQCKATIIFNNYATDGRKMTKQFNPRKMSRIYNEYWS